jgi:hypothetical protein
MLFSAHKIKRYTALLICLVILMVAAPLTPADWSGRTLEISFNLILLAGVYPTAWYSSYRWPFTILTLVTLIVRWLTELLPNLATEFISSSLTLVWIASIVLIIVVGLFRQKVVTSDVVVGAIVAYFLIAVGFSQMFIVIEILGPGSFSGLPEGKEMISMIYFSLGSISGVNFSSVLPVAEIARSLSTLAAVFGMFYVAVTVARLVGLNIASESNKAD